MGKAVKKMNKVDCMTIRMKSDIASAWNYFLQKGFFLDGVSGMSVHDLLREVLHFDDEFIEQTVRTIFLNNGPVDDIYETRIKDGDRMALGSAMPGLVGIVMGRDNPYKSFRDDISEHDNQVDDSHEPIRVSMKLFSVLTLKTRDDVLKRGIIAESQALHDFLQDKAEWIIEADGKSAAAFLADIANITDQLAVRVVFE